MAFLAETISDQKRLARGEHWLLMRNALRTRDFAHNKAWRLLIVAGPEPQEEITCIKELMPAAHITAVDCVPENVELARVAGADEVIVCDLSNFRILEEKYHKQTLPPPEFEGLTFDAICLDLTCHASEWLQRVVRVYFDKVLTNKGVMSVTFSYGRDVLEAYQFRWNELKGDYPVKDWTRRLTETDISDDIMARIYWALGARCQRLLSVIQYAGKAMPMISCVFVKRQAVKQDISWIKILPDDFVAAVLKEDVGNIYACPQERILTLRRSAAAKKAVQTRLQRRETRPLLELVDGHHPPA